MLKSGKMKEGQVRNSKPLFGNEKDYIKETIGDTGGASRFFKNFVPFMYAGKASKMERNEGCEGG